MKSLALALLPGLVGLVAALAVIRWLTRRRQPPDPGSAVSLSWLNEHSYRRKGDDRQWK